MTMKLAAAKFSLGGCLLNELRDNGLTAAEARGVAEDIDRRANRFAQMCAVDRRIATASFMEEVANHEPQCVTWQSRAAVSVVVRSSVLERFHVNELLSSAAIKSVTTLAALHFDSFVASATDSSFGGARAQMDDRFPLACGALDAMFAAMTTSEDTAFETPAKRRPQEMPTHKQTAFPAQNAIGQAVFSGISPKFDVGFLDYVRRYAGYPLAVSSLSRLSRIPEKIAHSVELLLSRDMPIVTTNATIYPNGWVAVRHGGVAHPNSRQPIEAMLANTAGFEADEVAFRERLRISE